MSYQPLILPQSNRTLHNFIVYKKTIDLSANQSAGSYDTLFTTPLHLGHFYVSWVAYHSDNLVGATQPQINVGWRGNATGTSQLTEFVSAQALTATTQNRFFSLTTVSTQAAAPPGATIKLRRNAVAGSTTVGGSGFTQPAVGASVNVTFTSVTPISPSSTYAGQQIYIYGGATPSVYTIGSPYVGSVVPLTLVSEGSTPTGNSIPATTPIRCPGTVSLFIGGYFARADNDIYTNS